GKDRDLFGRRRGLTGDERGRLRRLRASRRELRAAARRVAREGGAPCFAFESHFGDVVAGGGFDLVVGNPPWVRGERLPARVRETLSHRYPSWRPSAVRGFGHLPDLAVAFVERALELAAPGGCIALLVPAKLASSGYAEPLRQRLSHGTRIERAARLADAAGAFGAAAVYPMALIATRAEPGPADETVTAPGPRRAAPRLPQRPPPPPGPWVPHPAPRGRCFAPRSPWPAIASCGPISPAASPPRSPTTSPYRSTRRTASPRALRTTPARSPRGSTAGGSRHWRGCAPTRHAGDSGASTPAWCASCRCRRRTPPPGPPSPSAAAAARPTTGSSRSCCSSMLPTSALWNGSPRILSAHPP